MSRRLFCYGTLESPALVRRLTGCRFSAERAVLEGYARRRVRGDAYPGIVAARGQRVAGTLYRGLGAAPLRCLDRYEGALYRRRCVRVRDGSGRVIVCWAYVIAPRRRRVLERAPWDGAVRRARGRTRRPAVMGRDGGGR